MTHEGARHLDDVLTRRTRISIEAWDRVAAERDSQTKPDDETAETARLEAPDIAPL